MKINPMGTGVAPVQTKSMEAQIKHSESTLPSENRKVNPQLTKTNEANDKRRENENTLDDEMMQKAMEQANKTLSSYNRHIERAVHEVTKSVMYTIKDSSTNEIIAEFPPKKIQDMIAKMWEIAGLFVDEKA